MTTRRPIARAARAAAARDTTSERPHTSGYGLKAEAFTAELREACSHVDTLRTRIIDANIVATDAQFGFQALQELDVAHEELRVVEEELHAQAEEIVATREQLEQERRRYRELFNAAPEAYLITNEAGTVVEANRRAGVLFNLDPAHLVNKPLRTFVALGDRDRFVALLRRLEDRSFRGELSFCPRHSDEITVQVSAQMTKGSRGHGAIRWMMQLARTKDTEAEISALKARLAELEQAKAALERQLAERTNEPIS